MNRRNNSSISIILSSAFRNSIGYIIIFFLTTLLLLLASIISLQIEKASINNQAINNYTHSTLELILNDVSLIAHSSFFIDYIRSGSVSRAENYPELSLWMSNLNDPLIKGVRIIDQFENLVFQSGIVSSSFLDGKLCYTNEILDPVFGNCQGNITVYLDETALEMRIIEQNINAVNCSDCGGVNIDFEKLKSDILINKEKSLIYAHVANDKYSYAMISFIILGAIALVAVFIAFVLKKYNTTIHNQLIRPLLDLSKKIENDQELNSNLDAPKEVELLRESLEKTRKREREVAKLKLEVERGRIISQISHDMRSPLMALRVGADTIEESPEKARKLIQKCVDRLTTFSQDILGVSKNCSNEANSPTPIDELLNDIIEEKRRKLESKFITLNLNSKVKSKCDMKIDSSMFGRIFSNLLQNAIDAIDSLGEIHIEAETTSNKVLCHIKDNGKGIRKEILDKIGQRGFSFGKKEGNGLGIWGARSYLNSIGGSLTIQSEEKVGTSVTIEIPIENNPGSNIPEREFPI